MANYIHYTDDLGRDHIEGTLSNGRSGIWVTQIGYKFSINESEDDFDIVPDKESVVYKVWEQLND